MNEPHVELFRELLKFRQACQDWEKAQQQTERQAEPISEPTAPCPDCEAVDAKSVVEPLEFHVLKTRVEFFHQLLVGIQEGEDDDIYLADVLSLYEQTFKEVLHDLDA